MKICELINKLNELKNQYGEDIEVAVQYRDDGGYYYGVDRELWCEHSQANEYNAQYSREDNVILL